MPFACRCAHRGFLLLSILGAVSVRAEQMYVADKLVINVYAEADQASERLTTLETGDRVETLDRTEDFVFVRLSDDREGWVGENYLTTDQPAAIRLRELEGEYKAAAQQAQKKLNEEIAGLQKQNATLQSQLDDLKQKAAAPPVVPEPAVAATPQPAPAEAHPAARKTSFAWMWAPLALLAGGASGYLLGYQALARRIRNKFGGVKIY
jgi:uncharacterized coiled-coil protein SlyX